MRLFQGLHSRQAAVVHLRRSGHFHSLIARRNFLPEHRIHLDAVRSSGPGLLQLESSLVGTMCPGRRSSTREAAARTGRWLKVQRTGSGLLDPPFLPCLSSWRKDPC
jgi:hypothetical protein